jgi:hypothetical protein
VGDSPVVTSAGSASAATAARPAMGQVVISAVRTSRLSRRGCHEAVSICDTSQIDQAELRRSIDVRLMNNSLRLCPTPDIST